MITFMVSNMDTTIHTVTFWRSFIKKYKVVLAFILPISIGITMAVQHPIGIVALLWLPGFLLLSHYFGKRTKSISIDGTHIYINKKAAYTFIIDDTTIKYLESRSHYKGLFFRMNFLEVVIWKGEFTDQDWQKLLHLLKAKTKIRDTIHDYGGELIGVK